MNENFRQRAQRLSGDVIQVDAPRGGGLWFAPLALFAAVADTDGAPRVTLGRMLATWSGAGYEGGEESCTPGDQKSHRQRQRCSLRAGQ